MVVSAVLSALVPFIRLHEFRQFHSPMGIFSMSLPPFWLLSLGAPPTLVGQVRESPMETNILSYIVPLTGTVFGLFGVLGTAILSYAANHRLSMLLHEHNNMKMVLDEVHVSTNSR